MLFDLGFVRWYVLKSLCLPACQYAQELTFCATSKCLGKAPMGNQLYCWYRQKRDFVRQEHSKENEISQPCLEKRYHALALSTGNEWESSTEISTVLWLYFSVPIISQTIFKTTTILTGDGLDDTKPLIVRKDEAVKYSVHAMHRLKRLYGIDTHSLCPEH